MTALVALSLFQTASACICFDPEPNDAFDRSELVVLGTITSVHEHPNPELSTFQEVEVLVSEAFKGSEAGAVVRFAVDSGNSCSLYPEPGELWIWYVHEGRSGMCTRSTRVNLYQQGPPQIAWKASKRGEAPPQDPYQWVPGDLKELYALRERTSPAH